MIPIVADPWFYAVAVPAVLLMGVSKSGFASGFGSLATPMLALTMPVPQAAAILLPIIIVVASIYGASNKHPNNFGRNLFLQNLQGINFCSSAYMTGSNANLIAVAFILSMGGSRIYYTDWMFASLPVVIITGPEWFRQDLGIDDPGCVF